LPELAGVTAAVAPEKRVAAAGFDRAHGRVRLGEAAREIGERGLGDIAGRLALRGGRQHLVG